MALSRKFTRSERDVKAMSKDTNAPWRDEALLREKYVDEREQPKEIIEEFGCSRTTLYKWINEYGLKEEREAAIDRPWRDEDTLRELYIERDMSVFEVGGELGCSGSAVQRNLKKAGIETRSEGGTFADAPYKQREQMLEWYEERGLSTWEIADKCDVSQATIWKWLHKHGIETRKSKYETAPTYWTQKNGYERIQSAKKGVFVHQLVAIANGADPYKVMGDLTHVVHHKKPIPWLNTPGNLELISQSDHRNIHGNQYTD